MNKAIIVIFILLCLTTLIGCDPIYPPGKLKIKDIESLSVGKTINIEIIYPNTGGSIVFGWKDQNLEIISGSDIVSVSGLSLTGIKSGTVKIKINATTRISDEAIQTGREEKVYSKEIEIKVK